eukprot:TRINITY_DN2060_c0_g1_i1.p1 TRINITY_DN2060_c0_g1~~TRINITY_DN2060_c0_g1_i1.p1  ORF type:complete len:130 (+),score=35.67 TRINITY_DN2060_c0_g1_i1:117-506(+)
MIAKDEEVDVEVTKDDQLMINSFSRGNRNLHELETELKIRQDSINNVQDAANELLLADDEDALVKYRLGEIFVEVKRDEATSLLEKEEAKLNEEIDYYKKEIENVRKLLGDLKVKLYAKFGNSINLEEE